MTREEQIKQKAYEISQRCFPDSQNIWARPNIEAQLVQHACCEISKWIDEHPKEGLVSLDKVCEWLQNNMYCQPIFEYDEDQVPVNYVTASGCDSIEELINKFKKSMNEHL